MTKAFVIASLVFAAGSAFANPRIDCSFAVSGEVKIRAVGNPYSTEQLAEMAFSCLKTRQVDVVNARAEALTKARENSTHPNQCYESEKLQTLILSSWYSDRPEISEGPYGELIGTQSGESTVLLRDPFLCSGVGSGLFGGIVAAVSANITVQESYSFPMDENSHAPGRQEATVKLNGLMNL